MSVLTARVFARDERLKVQRKEGLNKAAKHLGLAEEHMEAAIDGLLSVREDDTAGDVATALEGLTLCRNAVRDLPR